MDVVKQRTKITMSANSVSCLLAVSKQIDPFKGSLSTTRTRPERKRIGKRDLCNSKTAKQTFKSNKTGVFFWLPI